VSASADAPIVISRGLLDRLVETVRSRFPEKAFGYLVSDVDERTPTDFVAFGENVRNTSTWKGEFHAYGRYFIDHDDAGFVAAPEEAWRLQQEIWAAGLFEVGVFHSHQRHPANFSQIDYEMHISRFTSLWHLIVSMRNPELPQLRAFDVSAQGIRELRLHVITSPTA
jgi:proteasome lid subunit RPN8/RPN11